MPCVDALIFALPSRYEGLGCVYLEAMSVGKPVIGCRGQGIADIIQHGTNGFLVGPDNDRELALALECCCATKGGAAILPSPRGILSSNGLRFRIKRAGWLESIGRSSDDAGCHYYRDHLPLSDSAIQ